ncbi:DMT family transporter [Chengkuizengella axinellae]|uniref:DMT family transporter n=1 Tax=Chengkuizengella axinellae TaxID=3064388 RepID=A0ABT9IUB3_9BACL|nr:DMT family transporter [Chengkuizengella sp. 2205SS18-9]MDP5272941.1 DMT family transporter [Chengkuizengella sp. 2205SS18-9]
MKNKNTLPVLAGLLGAIIIGLSFLFLKNIVNEASILSILSFRFTIAFFTMSIFVFFKVVRVDFRNKPILLLLLFSFIQPVLAFSFQTYGMKYATSSEAGVITALLPIFVMLLASIFLKERTSLIQKGSILLSAGGVLFIGFMSGVEGDANMLGFILIILSVLSMAVYSVLARKFSKQFTALELTYAMMAIGMIMFNFILLISPEKMDYSLILQPDFMLSIIYLGFFSSVVSSFLTNYMIANMGASRSGVFMNLSTIVSIIAGVFILNEAFYTYHLVGTICIIVGVIGANMKGIHTGVSNKPIQGSPVHHLK